MTIHGYGHADGGVSSTCADTYISNYFINLTLPPKGASCRQDVVPLISDRLPDRHDHSLALLVNPSAYVRDVFQRSSDVPSIAVAITSDSVKSSDPE